MSPFELVGGPVRRGAVRRRSPERRPRTPSFPFPLLTTAVSLEAIVLALFVLASQNRLARQADMRSHLDLQIDLLAQREMTAVLRLLEDLTAHFGVATTVTRQQIRDLARTTDIQVLTERMDALGLPNPHPRPRPRSHRSGHPAGREP